MSAFRDLRRETKLVAAGSSQGTEGGSTIGNWSEAAGELLQLRATGAGDVFCGTEVTDERNRTDLGYGGVSGVRDIVWFSFAVTSAVPVSSTYQDEPCHIDDIETFRVNKNDTRIP